MQTIIFVVQTHLEHCTIWYIRSAELSIFAPRPFAPLRTLKFYIPFSH